MVLERILKNEKQILAYNAGILKFYGNGYVKAIVQRCTRVPGFVKFCKTRYERLKEAFHKAAFENELNAVSDSQLLPLSLFPETKAKTERAACSVSRLKSRVQELILCNHWNCFVTFTLDKTKRERNSLDSFDALTRHLKYIRQTRCPELRFMLLLEQHKNGGYHGHALMYLPADFIAAEFIINANGYFEWVDISSRFGFMSIKPYDGTLRACNYVTKYVTKDLIPGRVLRTSKGLNKPYVIRNLSIGISSNISNVYRSEYVISVLMPFDSFEFYYNDSDILIE